MDNYSLDDNGDLLTEEPKFAVVYLTQGAGEADKCIVSCKIFAREDHNKIKRDDKQDEDDYPHLFNL
jgi:hypothetical protein